MQARSFSVGPGRGGRAGGHLQCGVTGPGPGVWGHRAERVEVVQGRGWQLVLPPPPASAKTTNWVREGWRCRRAWGVSELEGGTPTLATQSPQPP